MVTEISAVAGADLPSRPRSTLSRLFRRLWAMLARKPERAPAPAAFETSAAKLRNPDDPFSDPEAQHCIRGALAEKARNRKRRRG